MSFESYRYEEEKTGEATNQNQGQEVEEGLAGEGMGQNMETSDAGTDWDSGPDSDLDGPNIMTEINQSNEPLGTAIEKINAGGDTSYLMKSLNSIDFKFTDSAKISDAKRQIAEAILGKGGYRDVLGNWENLKDLRYEDKDIIAYKFKEIINNSDGLKREEYIDYLKQNLSAINGKDDETVGLFNDILIEEDALLYREVLERYEASEDINYQMHNQNYQTHDQGNLDIGNSLGRGIRGGKMTLDSNESSDKQIVSEKWVYDKIIDFGINDPRKIAYILATVKGECAFKNQKEIGGENRPYGQIDAQTGKAYYGRGFVQLTHKDNYQKFTDIIRSEGKDFMDNDGNIIKGSEIDLVNNPDLILQSNDLALFILLYGMENGTFTGKKLDDFINNEKTDYIGARGIVNGKDKAEQFALNAKGYENTVGDLENSVENLTA